MMRCLNLTVTGLIGYAMRGTKATSGGVFLLSLPPLCTPRRPFAETGSLYVYVVP